MVFAFLGVNDMDPSSIQPLLPQQREANPQQAALASAFAALVSIGQRAPRAVERVTEVTLGVGISVKPPALKPTPLILTWLLPQPIGIIPPEAGGLDADWWIPGAVQDPPEWVPGADRRRERVRDHAKAEEERLALGQWKSAIYHAPQYSDADLKAIIIELQTGTGSFGNSYRPQELIEVFQAELDKRAAARAQASPPASPSPQVPNQQATPKPNLPSGFVELVEGIVRRPAPTPAGPFADDLMSKLGTDP